MTKGLRYIRLVVGPVVLIRKIHPGILQNLVAVEVTRGYREAGFSKLLSELDNGQEILEYNP